MTCFEIFKSMNNLPSIEVYTQWNDIEEDSRQGVLRLSVVSSLVTGQGLTKRPSGQALIFGWGKDTKGKALGAHQDKRWRNTWATDITWLYSYHLYFYTCGCLNPRKAPSGYWTKKLQSLHLIWSFIAVDELQVVWFIPNDRQWTPWTPINVIPVIDAGW